MAALLQIRDLSVHYRLDGDETAQAVRGVDLTVERGQVTALVGESGAGKSTIALCTIGLLPPNARLTSGQILFQNADVLTMEREPLRRLLGNEIAMLYEDPGKRLDPMMRVGVQLEEVMVAHRELSSAEMRERVIAELALMKLPEPEDLFDAYPHELADGMVHRVMLAMATILRHAILIADEPTSRFDAILKSQILDVLLRMKQDANLSMLLITHDMGAVVQLADQVAVMYAGRVAEVGSVQEIFRAPQHPYTAALIAALDPFARVQEPRLQQIPGEPADLSAKAGHCPFLARCAYASATCVREPEPGLSPPDAATPSHQSACYHPIPPKA